MDYGLSSMVISIHTFQPCIVNIYLSDTKNSAACFANIARKIRLNTINVFSCTLYKKQHYKI
jgi:hypothetical protein